MQNQPHLCHHLALVLGRIAFTSVMIHLVWRQQDPGRHSAHSRCCMLEVIVSGLTEPPPHP